jgi:carbon storage regulator
MLILTRKPGQAIRIGNDVIISVKEIRGRQVRLGIEAPNNVPVYREEIYEAVMEANREAVIPKEIGDSLLSALEGSDEPNKKNHPSREE